MPSPAITYLTVTISHDGIAETNGDSQALFLPRSDIASAELRRGIGAERPIVQSIAAAIFLAAGIAGIVAIIRWTAEGGTLIDVHLLLLVNLIIGLWLLYGVIRRRILLRVTTSRGDRKVVFKGRVDHAELTDFIEAARRDFDYPIKSSLLEAG